MAFTSVEIIALIFAIGILVKLLFVLVSKDSWMKFAKGIYKKPTLLMVIELILAAVVFYYLIQELSIVQIVACATFGALLTGMSFAAYGKELMPMFTKIFRVNVFKRAWLPVLAWLALAVWTLLQIF